MSDSVVVVEQSGGIATVTVNRPDKLNALNAQVIGELTSAFRDLDAPAAGTRVAIMTGAGEKAFVAGADIAEMRAMGTAAAKAFADAGHRLGAVMEGASFPIIAAVNGFALGGGCELALACDFIYASDRAKFGQPEVNLAVIPGFGGTQRLARRVGIGRARELVYTADMIDAERAYAIGLVNAVVPAADLMTRVRAVAEKIAAKGPVAIAQAKRAILRGESMDLPGACELEAQAFAMLFGTADQKEGMAAFVEKRKASFKGE